MFRPPMGHLQADVWKILGSIQIILKLYIQGVTGGTDQISGGCSLC